MIKSVLRGEGGKVEKKSHLDEIGLNSDHFNDQ